MKKLYVALGLAGLSFLAHAQMTPLGAWNTIDDKTNKPKALAKPGLAKRLGNAKSTLLAGLKNIGSTQRRALTSHKARSKNKKPNRMKKSLLLKLNSNVCPISTLSNAFELRQGH